MPETQPITVACQLQVNNTLAKEIDETLLVFASACDWVNDNTPAKMANKTAMQSLVYQDVIPISKELATLGWTKMGEKLCVPKVYLLPY